jgi:hypothetical protein
MLVPPGVSDIFTWSVTPWCRLKGGLCDEGLRIQIGVVASSHRYGILPVEDAEAQDPERDACQRHIDLQTSAFNGLSHQGSHDCRGQQPGDDVVVQAGLDSSPSRSIIQQ